MNRSWNHKPYSSPPAWRPWVDDSLALAFGILGGVSLILLLSIWVVTS